MQEDYHVHTAFSDDSDYAPQQVIEDAIRKGITHICITDHVDYGIKRDWDDPQGILYRKGGPGEPDQIPLANVDYPAFYREITRLQAQYKERIQIGMGMEFGMQSHTIPDYEKLFASYPFDFIILSVHEVEDKEFWTGDFQKGRTREKFHLRYYEEMLYLVQHYHHYSVLGHMDLITRYDPEGALPFEAIRPVVEQILKTVIADGKGIEINTSSTRYGLELTPCREILTLYKELGGKIITIGSDSHKETHLGFRLRETAQLLQEMGFESVCTFEQMQPVFHPIEAFL